MTSDEATKTIDYLKEDYKELLTEEDAEALDMAIEALQKPPISQRSMYQAGYRQAQEDRSSGDLISRAEAIEAVNDACNYCDTCDLKDVGCSQIRSLKELPSADRPRDGDLISRQDAIETVGDWMVKEFGYLDINRGERLIDAIEARPSAGRPRPINPTIVVDLESGVVPISACEPRGPKTIVYEGRPKGEWRESREQNILMAKRIEKGETWRVCSNCGTGFMIGAQLEEQKCYGERFHNFCPRCGADMRGGERSE